MATSWTMTGGGASRPASLLERPSWLLRQSRTYRPSGRDPRTIVEYDTRVMVVERDKAARPRNGRLRPGWRRQAGVGVATALFARQRGRPFPGTLPGPEMEGRFTQDP